jgi:hypothetical protein
MKHLLLFSILLLGCQQKSIPGSSTTTTVVVNQSASSSSVSSLSSSSSSQSSEFLRPVLIEWNGQANFGEMSIWNCIQNCANNPFQRLIIYKKRPAVLGLPNYPTETIIDLQDTFNGGASLGCYYTNRDFESDIQAVGQFVVGSQGVHCTYNPTIVGGSIFRASYSNNELIIEGAIFTFDQSLPGY